MTNPELVEWIQTAPGLRLNPDGHYGLQCVDTIDAYGEAIFGVHWSVCVGSVRGAKQLLDVTPDEYWIRTDNDSTRADLIPSPGDVVVFGGSPINEWGHTAVVESADQNGMWVIQQDGFAAPTVFVDGGWYSDKPAHRAWLPYYGTGTGWCIGWLTPREEKIVGYKPPAPAEPIDAGPLPYQRDTLPTARVAFRNAPKPDAGLIEWFEPDHRYDFKGFVQKKEFEVYGNGVWFVGRYTDGFSWSGGFTDTGTHDLADLTSVLFPDDVPPVQEAPDVFLNGIDISSHQAGIDLTKVPGEFVAIKATEGVGYINPELAKQVASARESGKAVIFYHYARPGAGNTASAELDWFLQVVDPYLQIGDCFALDWEEGDIYRTDWAYEWLSAAEMERGAKGLIYLNNDTVNRGSWTDTQKATYNWDHVEAHYPLWLAAPDATAPANGYRPIKMPWPVSWIAGHLIWQYSFNGRLDGYAGDLDLNILFGNRDTLKAIGVTKLGGEEPKPEPEPNPEPKPVNTDIEKLSEFRDFLGEYIERVK